VPAAFLMAWYFTQHLVQPFAYPNNLEGAWQTLATWDSIPNHRRSAQTNFESRMTYPGNYPWDSRRGGAILHLVSGMIYALEFSGDCQNIVIIACVAVLR
jgi:hypothetical protein